MRSGLYTRSAVLLAMMGITVGLAACGSSDATVRTVAPVPAATQPAPTEPAVAVTEPVITVPATSTLAITTPAPAANDVTATTAAESSPVTDAEVADLEKQLDDIDQLLAGVDSDLKQD